MINIAAKKIGMTHIFQKNGPSVPLTILKVYENCILDIIINKDKTFLFKKQHYNGIIFAGTPCSSNISL